MKGTYLNIVMEYLPYTLHDVIQKQRLRGKAIVVSDVQHYMVQLFRACGYLSRRHICHRDIKPHNILVDPNTHAIRYFLHFILHFYVMCVCVSVSLWVCFRF